MTTVVKLNPAGVQDLLTDPGVGGATFRAAGPIANRARAYARNPELEGGEAGVWIRRGTGRTRARTFVSSALVMEARQGHLAKAVS